LLLALEPAFQAIVGGKLSAAQIRRLRSYKLTESTIDTLVDKGVLPEGWPDPARYFGTFQDGRQSGNCHPHPK
jgi:hypothetical protein